LGTCKENRIKDKKGKYKGEPFKGSWCYKKKKKKKPPNPSPLSNGSALPQRQGAVKKKGGGTITFR